MFSNAKSVEINGKEVKSIILENGAILYKKNESYPLSVTSDKNILSHYDNDVATLTATLTRGGVPIEGEEAIFHTSNITIGIEEYSTQDYNCIEMNLEGDGEIILPNSTQFSVQAFTEDGINVVWEDLSKGDWKIKINNGELSFYQGINTSPLGQSSPVGNKFSLKIFSKTSNDLYEISSSYPVFFASAITQNNGQCSVTYSSQGIGDVSINVECMNLQETYELEDCVFYDSCTSNAKASYWTIPTGVTSTYDSDGWKVTANAYKQVKLTDKLTSSSSVEFTIADYSDTKNSAIIIYAYTNGETTPNQAILMGGTNTATGRKVFNTQLDHDLIKNTPYRIEYTSSTIKVYENNTLLGSASNSVGLPTRFEFHTNTERYAVYKDLKVKVL